MALTVGDSIALTLARPLGADTRARWGALSHEVPGQMDEAGADLTVVAVGVNDALALWLPFAPVERLPEPAGVGVLILPRWAPWLALRHPVMHPRRWIRLRRMRRTLRRLAVEAGYVTVLPSLRPWWWRGDAVHLNDAGLAGLAARCRSCHPTGRERCESAQ